MKKVFKWVIIALLLIACGALGTVYVLNNDIIVLNSKGMIGLKERELLITASLLMLIVVIPVYILTIAFAWKYREGNEKAKHAPDWEHNYIAEYCWWGIPCIIIIILAVVTYKTTHELNPFRPIPSEKPGKAIQAVALNWKWLFIYPEEGIAAVNYVEFPEKRPIDFEITADAPMNSFWIPQLGGQIYAMPAMRTQLHLIANEVGTFSGRSSNISGKGFAGMLFTAKATTEEGFKSWVASVKKTAKTLTMEGYEQLVQPSEYNPVEFYVLEDKNLFDRIIQKYKPE